MTQDERADWTPERMAAEAASLTARIEAIQRQHEIWLNQWEAYGLPPHYILVPPWLHDLRLALILAEREVSDLLGARRVRGFSERLSAARTRVATLQAALSEKEAGLSPPPQEISPVKGWPAWSERMRLQWRLLCFAVGGFLRALVGWDHLEVGS